jgi:hypothetical protein
MTIPHLHLLLNHFPVLGAVIGLGLLLLSLVRKNEHLKRAGFEVWFVVSLLTIPAYLSGNAAEQGITDLPGVSMALIAAHEDAAVFALGLMQITGVLAWLALWIDRRGRATHASPLPVFAAVLLFSVLTVAAMARTATLGGEIRHPEIASTVGVGATQASPGAAAWVAAVVIENPWAWPANETLHFIGLTLVFAVVLPLNLRVLGVMRRVPFAALHRLLPWAMLGFVINAVTGMMFFIAAAEQYAMNPAFYWKIAFLVGAGANILYLTGVDDVWTVGEGATAPAIARAVAASSIVLWFGVIFWGRLMPFLGLTF